MQQVKDKQAMDSILEFWQQIVSDEEMPVQNRMKASELLYRSLQQKEEVPTLPVQETELGKRIEAAKAIIAKYADKGGEHASDHGRGI